MRQWIDGYDVAIHYVDSHIGLLLVTREAGAIKRNGILAEAGHKRPSYDRKHCSRHIRLLTNKVISSVCLHSDKWGHYLTFMQFEITGGKITRLDVGQAE